MQEVTLCEHFKGQPFVVHCSDY